MTHAEHIPEVDILDIAEYAIRYCITRQSYAFADGLDLAERYWRRLSRATRDDVLTATRVHGFPTSESPKRWPQIWAARYPEQGGA